MLRGTERVEIAVTLGEQPKLAREAERRFFDRLGFTAREPVYADAVERRQRPGSWPAWWPISSRRAAPPRPPASGRMTGVREIDGAEVKEFAEATTRLAAIEGDAERAEFVLLVARGNETAVLRVKLK